MSIENEMLEALASFVIRRVNSFNEKTSPIEIVVLVELVKVINQMPRTIKALD